jgi:hypothetical protein
VSLSETEDEKPDASMSQKKKPVPLDQPDDAEDESDQEWEPDAPHYRPEKDSMRAQRIHEQASFEDWQTWRQVT